MFADPRASPNVDAEPIRVLVNELGRKFRLIGRTGQPLYQFTRVQGVVIEGPQKGWEGGPNLLVQRVNGVATQEHIRVPLRGSFAKPGAQRQRRRRDDDQPPLEKGQTYEFAGYEQGEFVGTPLKAYEEAGIEVNFQTSDLYFMTHFLPMRTARSAPIVFGPGDFIDRKALLQGTAVSRDGKSFLDGPGWRLLVNPDGAWPAWMEGKEAEALGVIRRGPGDDGFRVDTPTSRLVKLADQVGRRVELRGRAWSMNGTWWFEYRGQRIYVDGMEKLPGWTADNHARPMAVRGTLTRARRPDLGQITLVEHPPLKEYFVVADPAVEPIDDLLAPEEGDGRER